MPENLAPKIAFGLYDRLWRCGLPWLRFNKRLAEGYQQRILKEMPPAANIWIQAASVGEAYLALEIIKTFRGSGNIKILATANTRQGVDILNQIPGKLSEANAGIDVSAGYFPFDKPSLMRKAVLAINPMVMVLLETEIWPGLLRALKEQHTKIIVINGRITDRSLKKYLLWPSIWPDLRPDRILAISAADADRFKQLFGPDGIETMPNIKFDRLVSSTLAVDNQPSIQNLLPSSLSFVVLASVRRQEEPLVRNIINEIFRRRPQTIIGLFPRHLHRIRAWQQILKRAGIRWSLRSVAGTPAKAGTVILWDTFGELMPAYKICKSAFVGGSLAPLGGQNFLEALICGTKPVIGPSWDNFTWVGTEIINLGLLQIADNWQEVAALLLKNMENPPPRDEIKSKAFEYIKERQGGAEKACRAITALMEGN